MSTTSTPRNARVISSDLLIRTQPRVLNTSKTGRALQYGQIVEIDPSKETTADGYVWWSHNAGGWSAARTVNSTKVYMELVPVTNEPPTPPPPQTGTAKFRVTIAGIRVRKSASSSAQSIGQLALNDIVTVNTASRTESNGYIWWQHERGWSAAESLDGIQQFMVPYTPPDPGSATILEVPWATQVDPVTAPGANDCGPACVCMLLRYYGKAPATMTVKTLSTLKPGLTSQQDLAWLSSRYGQTIANVPLPTETSAFTQSLKAQIDIGKPLILLVWYSLLGLQNPVAAAGSFNHWLVAVGYDGDDFIVNDPLWMASQRQGRGGSNVPIKGGDLFNAYRKAAIG